MRKRRGQHSCSNISGAQKERGFARSVEIIAVKGKGYLSIIKMEREINR